MAAEVKANLTAAWREVAAKTPALAELGELQRAAAVAPRHGGGRELYGLPRPQRWPASWRVIDLSRQAQVKAMALGAPVAAAAPAAAAPVKKK
jgi:nitrite reductase (cytochrome c-552)